MLAERATQDTQQQVDTAYDEGHKVYPGIPAEQFQIQKKVYYIARLLPGLLLASGEKT